MTRGRRPLRPDELELWQAVAGTTRPLHPGRAASLPVDPAPLPDPVPPRPSLTLPTGFRPGGAALPRAGRHDLAPSLPDSLKATPLRMDRKTFAAMTRGKTTPDARLDLHGMTLVEAHAELIRFVLNAQSAGLRLVLVITGKGKLRDDTGPIPARLGALRHQVPQWLTLPPLGPAVLQVAQAHLKHGGAGAYYVYLRRSGR